VTFFFKKKLPVSWLKLLLIEIFQQLPEQYHVHADQIGAGLISGMARRPASGLNYLGFAFGDSVNEYEDTSKPLLEITGIGLFSKRLGSRVEAGVTLYSGLPIGMHSQIPLTEDDIDFNRIDVSQVKIKQPASSHTEELRRAGLSVNDAEVWEVYLDGDRLLHLRDLADGDFVALRTNGPDTNGPDTNGPDTNGADTNGFGTNGPGTNGPHSNGVESDALSGNGPRGADPSAAGLSATGLSAAGLSATDPSAAGLSGDGLSGDDLCVVSIEDRSVTVVPPDRARTLRNNLTALTPDEIYALIEEQ
jgi:hypothetical protein